MDICDRRERLRGILERDRDEMIAVLQKWIRIPSVLGEAAPGAPYGRETRRMLDTALADCAAFGLETADADGYAGHADLGEGDPREALAILAHLDVVPEGTGWDGDPYGGQLRDGKIFGRGTSDDKGPAVAALFAMKAVREAGIPLKRKVRLILGCNEEAGGGEDLRYYASKQVMPRSGFSPDAAYPVINIEKGGMHLVIEGSTAPEGLQVLSVHAGTRTNVIPGSAEALVKKQPGLEERINRTDFGFEVSARETEEGVLIVTKGVLGHAAMPEQARNAIGQLLLVLRELGAQGDLARLAEVIGVSYDGKGLGIAMRDELSGALTASLDLLDVEDSRVRAVLDIRYPLTAGAEELLGLARMALPGMKLSGEHAHGGHYVPRDSELVRGLLRAYEHATGRPGYTVAIGGGTYAHYMEEGVAFGSTMPDEPDMAHQANEYMTLETLFKNAEIFADTIAELAAE